MTWKTEILHRCLVPYTYSAPFLEPCHVPGWFCCFIFHFLVFWYGCVLLLDVLPGRLGWWPPRLILHRQLLPHTWSKSSPLSGLLKLSLKLSLVGSFSVLHLVRPFSLSIYLVEVCNLLILPVLLCLRFLVRSPDPPPSGSPEVENINLLTSSPSLSELQPQVSTHLLRHRSQIAWGMSLSVLHIERVKFLPILPWLDGERL